MSATKSKPPYQKLASLTRKKNEIERLIVDAFNVDDLMQEYKEYMIRLENLYQACGEDNNSRLWLEDHKSSIEEFKSRIKKILDDCHRRKSTSVSFEKGFLRSTRSESNLADAKYYRTWNRETLHLSTRNNTSNAKFAASIPVRDKNGVSNKCKSELLPGNPRSLIRSSASSDVSVHSTSSARVRLAERKAKICAEKEHFEKLKKLEELETQIKIDKRDMQLNKELTECEILEKELNKIDSFDDESFGSLASAVDRIKAEFGTSKSKAQEPKTDLLQSCGQNKSGYIPLDTREDYPNRVTLAEALKTQNEISLSLRKHQESSSLPKKELELFDGTDITKFKGFWKKFKIIIESRCNNDIDRFTYLEQYTAGQAKKIVQSCCSDDPSTAYATAKHYLCREYDNEFKVAHAFLEILDGWPVIKIDDVEELKNLSVFLNKCKMHLENKSLSNQLNSPKEILGVVAKLPYRMRDKWRYKTLNVTRLGEIVSFDELASFVEEELEVLEQPLWGDINTQLQRKRTVPYKPGKILKTHTILDSSEENGCRYCNKKGHHITTCTKFGEESFDVKSDFVRSSGLCFSCLNDGHFSVNCRNKLTCSICNIDHPSIMHREHVFRSFENRRSTNFVLGAGKRIISPVVAARVKIRNLVLTVNVALDTHSSDCWIQSGLAEQLHAKLFPTTISLTTMHNKRKTLNGSYIQDLEIGDIDGNHWTVIPSLYVREDKEWPFVKEDLPSSEDIESYDHLQDVHFNFVRNEKVKLLIGMNMPGLIKPLKVVHGEFKEPFATQHWLGWSFNGPSVRKTKEISSYKITTNNIEEKFEALYAQDFVDPPYKETYSAEEKYWFDKVSKSLKKLDSGCYEVALPFYDEEVSFPSNKIQAERRFTQLIKRFNRDKEFYEEYDSFMQVMIEKGFAEKVPINQLAVQNGKEWYLVHHAVYHKQKKKIRIVFDCSLSYDGVSLNSKLMQGPDLTNTLVGVLLRFRQHKYAFTSDIEKMFYQVKVPPHHTNFLKFLWFNENGDINQYRLKVHVFGAKSSPSVANYALRQSADEYSKNIKIKTSIYKNFYVDDLLKSNESLYDAILMAKDIKSTIGKAQFNLTSFRSNSFALLGDLMNFPVNHVQEKDLKIEKTLGLKWDTYKDTLMFDPLDAEGITTRRGILKTVASLYDPLGLLAPAVLPAKRLFQETCRLKLQWDEKLPPDILRSWNKWTNSIKEVEDYEIQRCFKNMSTVSVSKIELHLFCDGSEIAYGAVAYLKFVSQLGIEISSPIYVKSRLTPVNNKTLKTVPRIELCGAKLAVEMAEMLVSELEYEFTCVTFWTDSTIVLAYLQNETKRFHRFVDNKVSFIRSRSSPQQWHHVASQENPADLVSRGASWRELSTSDLWRKGPKCLGENGEPEVKQYETLKDDIEIKIDSKMLKTNTSKSATCHLLESSSSFFKLKTKVAWILKFIDYLRKKVLLPKLTVDDLKVAECRIIVYIQKKNFTSTYLIGIRKLMPFIDSDGVWRVGGRLKNSSLQYQGKHPAILPGSSPLVKLLIRQAHASVGHLGCESTSSYLRQKFWITRGNSVIKSTIRECLICKKYQSKPTTQIMSDLPRTRTLENSVFKNVGIDYFGPFQIVHGRKVEKRYGVIFTCLSTRAAHLEIAHTLSTDSFINALRRFISRRGDVVSITSDNGTNFVGANNELREAVRSWNSETTEAWLKKRDIEWKFNPPCASHYGGVWEREIRTVRKVLDGLMREQPNKLTDESLLTLMCEVENILNNRPITPVSDDPNDLEALTPNHALLMNNGISLPPCLSYSNNYKKHWKRVQYLSSIFWCRWRREYLSILQQRQKWYKPGKEYKIGDLVMITDISLPRNQWPLGRIAVLKQSEDGRRRTAVVKVVKKQTCPPYQVSLIERPITKLVYLCHFD